MLSYKDFYLIILIFNFISALVYFEFTNSSRNIENKYLILGVSQLSMYLFMCRFILYYFVNDNKNQFIKYKEKEISEAYRKITLKKKIKKNIFSWNSSIDKIKIIDINNIECEEMEHYKQEIYENNIEKIEKYFENNSEDNSDENNYTKNITKPIIIDEYNTNFIEPIIIQWESLKIRELCKIYYKFDIQIYYKDILSDQKNEIIEICQFPDSI